jgi:hypothetical protein
VSTDYEYHQRKKKIAMNTRRGWHYIVIAGVIGQFMPLCIQIPVLVFVSDWLQWFPRWPAMQSVLTTENDRTKNEIARLCFKAALWVDFFVWLFPVCHGLVARLRVRSWIQFSISVIGVLVISYLIRFLMEIVLVVPLMIYVRDGSRRLRKGLAIGAVALLYLWAWLSGKHGHTFDLDSPKQVGEVWICAQGEDGPFWENGKDRDPVCHDPVRQCPALWFPVATEIPCPYKDPLGGPYTKDDLFVLNQTKHPR